jgi:3-dehydroquinate synthase
MNFEINKTQFNINLPNSINNLLIHSYRSTYELDFNNIDKDVKVLITKLSNKNDFIVMDRNIYNLYNFDIKDNIYLVDANEKNKTIYSSLDIFQKMYDDNFNKSNKLIVVGGGITQDISSFVSAIYKRGINWIFIPTTLLSMCDSCIGAKNALNHNDAKNQIGLFYAPSKVYINKNFLNTLSIGDIKSGLGEIIKLFLIGGREFMDKLDNISNLSDNNYLIELVYYALLIKKVVIELDEFDKNERNALNYGHTFGHIIEELSDYSIPHGIAVFMGMKIINNLFNFNCEYVNKLNNFIISDYNIRNINTSTFKQLLLNDKKVKNNKIKLIILEDYGKTTFKEVEITNHFIEKVINLI